MSTRLIQKLPNYSVQYKHKLQIETKSEKNVKMRACGATWRGTAEPATCAPHGRFSARIILDQRGASRGWCCSRINF